MDRAKNRSNHLGYSENHHIIPRSMGGTNSKDNLVRLTGREHFIAHLLLHKIYPDNIGMAIAITRMRYDNRRVINSKKYEWIRTSCANLISDHHKKHAKLVQNRPEVKEKHRQNAKKMWEDPKFQKTMRERNLGKNNPMYGVTQSREDRIKKSIANGGKQFSVWKSIKVKSSSKLGPGIFEKGEYIGTYINLSEASRDLKVWLPLIKKCLNNVTPQAQGYIFVYC